MLVLNVAIALGLALTGVGLLFGAWHRRVPRGLLPIPAGWALLLLSGWFWVAGTGVEFGISLLLLATSAVAWVYVVLNRRRRERRDRGEASPPKVAEGRSLMQHVLLFVLVVPLAAVASALVAVALSLALPVSEVDAMVTVLLIMPVLWGCGAYWAVADSRIARPAAAMVLGAVVGAAVIYV